MARYIDTGSGDPSQCLGTWMTRNITPGIAGLRCQFGYYRYRALYPFEDIIRGIVDDGNPVHLVFGSNNGSLVQADLEWTMEVLQRAPATSLVVVAFSNAEFHPKTVHVQRSATSAAAVVGSGNLTEAGLGLNVEAAFSLDSDDGDDATVIQQVADAIERWRTVNDQGVFLIEDQDDITALSDAGIINRPQPRPPRPNGGSSSTATDPTAPQVGSRTRLWKPQRRPARPSAVPTTSHPTSPAPTPAVVTPLPVAHWCKNLRSSDAQRVTAGTNPTGKLRLSRARHPIDQRRYFRYQLFGNEQWNTVVRGGNTYEVAEINFDVTIRGNHLGNITLTVDHAPHREANQHNVTTVLAWGSQINRVLTSTLHIGDWVLIERDQNGNFLLTIQQSQPTWAP